jgi:oligosaccharide repeat unit polymerase
MSIINLTTDIIFILLHFFLLLASYLAFGKKFFHPAVLFSLVWMGILALHFCFRFTLLDQLEALQPNVYFIFFVGNLFFLVGCMLSGLGFKKYRLSRPYQQQVQDEINPWLRFFFTAVILLGLPFYIQAIFKIFLASRAESFFSGLRYELSYGDVDIGPSKYLMPLAYVVFAFNLYSFYMRKNAINRALLIVALLSLITYAFFATGRTYFLMILSIFAGVSFFTNTGISIKKYLLAFVVFFLLFMSIGIIYGKGGSTEDSFGDNVTSSSQNTGIYLVTSLNALDYETSVNTAEPEMGDNTLRFFIKIGMELKLIPQRKVNELVQEFVFVPYATNVYTFYSPYIRDFGRIYAWVVLALLGALHSWFFNRAFYLKSKRAIVYFSFLLFPLLLSFFADQYFSLFSFWIQLVFFTELIFFGDQLVSLKKW